MTVSYKELGFSNTKEMFAKAMKEGYAVPAYNFNNMEQIQAIITACAESRSPVILQVSKGARQYANATLLRWMGTAEDVLPESRMDGSAGDQIHGSTQDVAEF